MPSSRTPKFRETWAKGDAFSRSSTSRSGGLRWSKGFDEFKHNLDGLADATIEQVAEKMKSTGSAILRDAVAKTYARKKWSDHEERHPSANWPNSRTAAEGLFIYMVRRKSFIELALGHNPRTIYRTDDGKQFDYGIQLEIGRGGLYAVIAPTLAAHRNTVMEAATNCMVESMSKVKRQNAGGRGTVHSGWSKTGKD